MSTRQMTKQKNRVASGVPHASQPSADPNFRLCEAVTSPQDVHPCNMPHPWTTKTLPSGYWFASENRINAITWLVARINHNAGDNRQFPHDYMFKEGDITYTDFKRNKLTGLTNWQYKHGIRGLSNIILSLLEEAGYKTARKKHE